MNIKELVKSKGFKKLLAKLYGFGASVVILGALFKIQHWTGAGFMLSAGLITEAIIFIFYAFDTDTEEENVPESEGQTELPERGTAGGGSGSMAMVKFDEMLHKAEISPDMFHSLGKGIKKLREATININSMGDVSGASTKYMNTIKTADEALDKLAKTYQNAIIKAISKTEFKYKNIADSLSVIESGVKSYQQQLESLNKNLSALNTVYMLHKTGADDYLKDMAESACDTKKYREQINILNDNLAALNNVYGNMLAAMNVRK
ncbi:MAG: gliding motility protein GldL [Bacteroidales bacterium]|jgi:gliding motility-associated protein GldL